MRRTFAVGLLLLTVGLGVGVAGELGGLDAETRLTGLSLAVALALSVVVLAVTDSLLAALAAGLPLGRPRGRVGGCAT